MRVLCIKDFDYSDAPKYGDECTVVDRGKCFCCNREVLVLKEFPFDGGYAAEHFIPLSEIDEMEEVQQLAEVC